MENARQQIVDAIKSTDNILVTVSSNPTVDELSAALGLTIILNNLDKRASAVFSGLIPPAISFLEPNKTFEPTAGSLRDFIIALDKEKADHLRYKVEGDVVKIFITPYRRMLTEKDLVFSQGDYNVELVIALGVTDQNHLDKALDAQGKILHSASIITVSSGQTGSTLGSLDWHDATASSLSEMIVGLSDLLKMDKSLLDQQIATALLTGIVSATDRFSNDKTTSRSMTMAAQLMAAGANQQLIAAKLEEAHDIAPGPTVMGGKVKSSATKPQDNTLTIDRSEKVRKDAQTPPKVGSYRNPLKNDSTTEPHLENTAAVSDEKSKQQEFENQLQNITFSQTATMSDIEAQLKNQSLVQQPSSTTTDSKDLTQNVVSPVPSPSQASQEKKTILTAPPQTVVPPVTPQANDNSNDNTEKSASSVPAYKEPTVDSNFIDQKDKAPSPQVSNNNPYPTISMGPPEPMQVESQSDVLKTTESLSSQDNNPDQYNQPNQLISNLTPVIDVSPQQSIVSDHSPDSTPSLTPPINGIISDPYEGEIKTIDPFSSPSSHVYEPLQPHTVIQPITQNMQTLSLDANKISNTEIQARSDSVLSPTGIPELPPLPPLPSSPGVSALPLPPPPPLVPDITPGLTLSGAVSSDIFATGVDMQPSSDTPNQQQDKPPGPGQFRIPGSAS